MSRAAARDDRLLLLGRETVEYGEHTLAVAPDGGAAVALSVGADPASPALVHKGRADEPNEDAVLAWWGGDRVLLAVADAHHGAHASHAPLEALHAMTGPVPGNPAALARALGALPIPASAEAPASAASFLCVVYRQDLRAGFGYSAGDASVVLIGGGAPATPLNARDHAYFAPAAAAGLDAGALSFFEFDAPPGALLAAFTDGVDACCYRRPDRSPGPGAWSALHAEGASEPATYARALMALALAGLPGEPGGQDNIAIAVAST